jgi:hypothetical protein
MAVQPVSHSAPAPRVVHNEAAAKHPAPKADNDHGGHVTAHRGQKVNKTA